MIYQKWSMPLILVYIFCFFLDDLVVFIIAMITFKVTEYLQIIPSISFDWGFNNACNSSFNAFKPEWLMFNFS
jgi:hypothetical protein